MTDLQVYDGTSRAHSAYFCSAFLDFIRRRSRDPVFIEHACHGRIAEAQNAVSAADVGPHTTRVPSPLALLIVVEDDPPTSAHR